MKKNIVICPHCHSVNKKKKLSNNEIAVCSVCKKSLYKAVDEKKLFAYSFSLVLFFVITLLLPIVKINIIGFSQTLNIIEAFLFLYSKGFIFLSVFVLFSIIVFPFLCFIFMFMLSVCFILKNRNLSQKLLILITILSEWCFLDIFFMAILVSLIKIVSYGSIEIENGFFAFVIVLMVEFYIFKFIGVHSLWEKIENL